MVDLTLIGIVVGILVVCVIVFSFVLPRVRGLHYTSRLTCPKCGKEFDYKWVPSGYFSIWGSYQRKDRYVRCPNCHGWSNFDLEDNRIDQTDGNSN